MREVALAVIFNAILIIRKIGANNTKSKIDNTISRNLLIVIINMMLIY